MPYWILATTGLSEMKVKRPRFSLKGSGMIKVAKSAISNTSKAKT
jgi:hypothetical protein